MEDETKAEPATEADVHAEAEAKANAAPTKSSHASAARAGFGVVVLGAILAGALGPRLTWPASKPAGAPFVFAPPAGFVPAEGDAWKAIQAASPAIRQGWYVPVASVETSRPTVNVMHAPQMDPVEVSDLDALAAGMPDIAARTNSTWRTVRVTREIRRDGARVGWIEGDCEKAGLKYHSIELVFPDDEGTSFVTAIVPNDQMDKWSPQFEASVQSATGVARRFGPPPTWMHLAWAAGGALLALLAGGIVQRRERRREAPPAPPERAVDSLAEAPMDSPPESRREERSSSGSIPPMAAPALYEGTNAAADATES